MSGCISDESWFGSAYGWISELLSVHQPIDALVKKLKAAGVNKGAMWPKGAVFSFVDYDEIPFGPSGVGKFSIMATSTETDPTTGVPDFKVN